jgi:hypothetical protein
MEVRKGGDSNDWFFLAMAKWRLNEKDEARKWFRKAVGWMEKNQPKNEELRRFRVEAGALLGLEVPPTLKEPPVLIPGPTLEDTARNLRPTIECNT